MIGNRFNHSSFPQPTGSIGRRKRSRDRSARRPLHVSKMRRPASSSSDSSDNEAEFGGAKVPLEGIELLLNRDKVPNDLGKKMDKETKEHGKEHGKEHERPQAPPASRFLRPDRRERGSRPSGGAGGLMAELDDVISDAESAVDSSDRRRPRRRPRFRRNRDRDRGSHPPKASFFPSSKGASPPTPPRERSDDEESVGSDISVSSGDVRHASGSDLESISEESGDSGSDSGDDRDTESRADGDSGSESEEEDLGEKQRRWRPPSHMSREEILAEKEQLLYDYGRLAENGYRTGIRLSMKTPLETLRAEVFRLKKLRSVQRSIRFQRKMLISVTSGLEYCNKRFNPYKFALDGWSGEVLDNIGDYDEVFEELHDKYSDSVQMAPELKLIAMVGGSGLMYHLSNTLFKSSTPQLNDILASNPNIMSQIQGAALNQMASQHSNDPIFGMMMGGLNMQQQQRAQGGQTFSQAGAEPAPRTSFDRAQPTRPQRRGPQPSNASASVGASVSEVPSGQGIMKGPEGVDDILAQLNGVEASQASLVSDVEEDEVREVTTSRPRARRTRKPKADNVIDLDM